MNREQLIGQLAAQLLRHPHTTPLRVAIDGVDTAGKTRLADELRPLLEAAGRPVIRASVDGFHNPRHIRHRLGPDSPQGYYQDSFNWELLTSQLLQPLGPHGNLHYRAAAFDYRTDQAVDTPTQVAAPNGILLFDGVFLQNPAIRNRWDCVIFVHVSFETVLQRAVQRDVDLFGSRQETLRRYQTRYIPGQQLYLAECRPMHNADWVVDNNDIASPFFISSFQ